MKKTFLLALSAFLALSLSAETMPTGYYDAINGKKDAELKTALSNIIKGGERLPYNTAYHSTTNVDPVTGDTIWKKGDFKPCTWLGFVTTDKRSDGTVWDMYSNTKRYFPVLGGSAAGLDIEHGFPKSWWGGDNNDAYKDLYHLCPADRIAAINPRKILIRGRYIEIRASKITFILVTHIKSESIPCVIFTHKE